MSIIPIESAFFHHPETHSIIFQAFFRYFCFPFSETKSFFFEFIYSDILDFPHKYSKNSVAYTGTHDNDTIIGWYKNEKKDIKEYVKKYLMKYLKLKKINEEKINNIFIEALWKSDSNLTIAQMQDFLGIDNRGRMNIPSTLGNNWKWRLKGDELSDELSKKIKEITVKYCR